MVASIEIDHESGQNPEFTRIQLVPAATQRTLPATCPAEHFTVPGTLPVFPSSDSMIYQMDLHPNDIIFDFYNYIVVIFKLEYWGNMQVMLWK